MRSPAESTIVVGGGLAGLAAAAALGQRGIPVTLLESRPRLGGRASSFVDRETGETIDNCQHVSLGCCTNFRHFCETVGIADLFRRERELYFIGADGVVNRFSAGRLPAPLHLWPAFRRLSYLNRRQKTELSRGLKTLAQHPPSDGPRESFADWLQRHDQSPETIERFWHVVLVSALSETPERIDVAAARKVFVDAFLAHRDGWEMQVPVVPLDELYGKRLGDWFATHNVTVRLQAGVKRLIGEDDRVTAVELRNGERIESGDFIVAVPHHRVFDLLPASISEHPQLRGIAELGSAPISSVHLWFDRPISDLPHAVFVGRLSQWLFNRGALRHDVGKQSYYQVVISASRNLQGLSQSDVIDRVVDELAGVWTATRDARLEHARLVTEHRAVFSPTPGSDELRPSQQSPISNLQLAGDWTRTSWPATMEGAVRSGYLAAENVLARRGQRKHLLQPDLPAALLSKLLLKL